MAVQAQLYSDHYQNNNNNNNMGDWVLMTGSSVFGSGGDQQQTQDQQRFLDSQKFMNSSASDYHHHHHNLVSSSSRRNGIIGFQNLSSELERQRLEMDCFLHFQNEKLKAVISDETRRREVILMQNYESKMKAIMEAKEEVLNTATNRTRELQNCLLMAEKEAKDWEKKAMENEAMVTDLNRKLSQARDRKHEEDAESVCYGNGGGGGDGDLKERQKKKKMVCKVCHVRSTCVLLLPCRHLCCCRPCEGLLMFCPVCETVKNGSLEVFFGLN